MHSRQEKHQMKKFYWSKDSSKRQPCCFTTSEKRCWRSQAMGEVGTEVERLVNGVGLDIATHLEVIETYAIDADTWQQIASEHQMPRA